MFFKTVCAIYTPRWKNGLKRIGVLSQSNSIKGEIKLLPYLIKMTAARPDSLCMQDRLPLPCSTDTLYNPASTH